MTSHSMMTNNGSFDKFSQWRLLFLRFFMLIFHQLSQSIWFSADQYIFEAPLLLTTPTISWPATMEPIAGPSSRSESPVSCEKCFISYGDFCVLYSGKLDLLIAFVPKYGRKKCFFVGYLATAYFKLVITDPAKRLHHFLHAAAELYPPTP